MSFRYASGINKPGFDPLAGQTTTAVYSLELYSWGLNGSGDLGLNTATNRSSPVQVGALTDWLIISNTYTLSASVKTDGTLWTWGGNGSGQLGINLLIPTSRSSPVQVGALTAWSKVSAGRDFCIAIKTDGTLWSWGGGSNGQLGHNNTTTRSSPVQVGALTTWSKVSAGNYYCLAIKTDGTLWVWGDNVQGQLGLNDTAYRSSPVQVGALTTWSKVSGATTHTLAIQTNGTLWSWGKNVDGQLGQNNTTYRSSPIQVGALTTWSSIDSAPKHSAAIKTNGTLWIWGDKQFGKLGLGDTYDNRSSPTQIGGSTTWTTVSLITSSSFAIKTNGTLWAWGLNAQGQLGKNDTTDRSSPVQVGALTTWLDIDAPLATFY